MFKKFMTLPLLLVSIPVLIAQAPSKWNITQTPKVAKPNETVELDIADLTPGTALTIDWKKTKGEGFFVGKTTEKTVTFKPTKAGDDVTLECSLSGAMKAKIEYTFHVEGPVQETANGKPIVEAPVPAPPQRPVPLPQAPHQSESLPTDAVPIGKIVDPSEASVIPSGWMADANTTAVSLVGGTYCKFDIECSFIGYDIANRKEGWAGFAWQVVPQGEKDNWGEHKGKDLSGRGYKSLRLWSKMEPGSAPRARIEFKSGGNVDAKFATTNRPSYLVSTGLVPVDSDWKEFCLDLSHLDLRNVVSPFTVVISAAFNPPTRIGVYIDGVNYSQQPCTKK